MFFDKVINKKVNVSINPLEKFVPFFLKKVFILEFIPHTLPLHDFPSYRPPLTKTQVNVFVVWCRRRSPFKLGTKLAGGGLCVAEEWWESCAPYLYLQQWKSAPGIPSRHPWLSGLIFNRSCLRIPDWNRRYSRSEIWTPTAGDILYPMKNVNGEKVFQLLRGGLRSLL